MSFLEWLCFVLFSTKNCLDFWDHHIINVPDMWWENKRITIHVSVIEALRSVGYELRNTIIWDRTNIVNNIGIFGWPSNTVSGRWWYVKIGGEETSETGGSHAHQVSKGDPGE